MRRHVRGAPRTGRLASPTRRYDEDEACDQADTARHRRHRDPFALFGLDLERTGIEDRLVACPGNAAPDEADKSEDDQQNAKNLHVSLLPARAPSYNRPALCLLGLRSRMAITASCGPTTERPAHPSDRVPEEIRAPRRSAPDCSLWGAQRPPAGRHGLTARARQRPAGPLSVNASGRFAAPPRSSSPSTRRGWPAPYRRP